MPTVVELEIAAFQLLRDKPRLRNRDMRVVGGVVDRDDFGAGYVYDAILEKATVK